jgi:hypothetical protein
VQGRPLYTVRQIIAHGTDTAPAPVHVSVPAPVSVGGDSTGHGDR